MHVLQSEYKGLIESDLLHFLYEYFESRIGCILNRLPIKEVVLNLAGTIFFSVYFLLVFVAVERLHTLSYNNRYLLTYFMQIIGIHSLKLFQLYWGLKAGMVLVSKFDKYALASPKAEDLA